MEPWWNNARDQQAMARLWRHGQKNPVECVRIFMKGSIDHRKIELRDGKEVELQTLALKGSPE